MTELHLNPKINYLKHSLQNIAINNNFKSLIVQKIDHRTNLLVIPICWHFVEEEN